MSIHSMTPLERVDAVLAGRTPDRVPVCLHNFLHAVHEEGASMAEYRTDPAVVANVHLAALERYQHDCLCIDLDTTMLAEAMGARAECSAEEPGRIVAPAIADLSEVDRLRPVDPQRDGRIPVLLDAIGRLSRQVGSRVAIRGDCDQGPFSLACLVRGIQQFLIDLATDPDNSAIVRLLEVCYDSHLETHRAVKKAGAHFTSFGDSLSGPDVIAPAMFARFAQPYQRGLLNELARDGIVTVLHVCGNTTAIFDQLADYPFCGFEIDYKTDALRAKRTIGAGHVLFGNIDPSAILTHGTPELVADAARRLIEVWKPGGKFILNAGCAIPATAPPANLHALVHAAVEHGQY
jgi:uroporphyrinogen decarboxylase